LEDSMTPKETSDHELLEVVRQFETAEQSTFDSRKLAERDRDYYDEKQWTAEEKAALEKRGQPVVTFNRIKRKVNSLMGLEKQTRKDPKAFPRNPNDQESADAATDSIRFVCDDSRWDDTRSLAAKELAIEGTCAVMVGVKQTKAGIDPDIRRISWDRFYADPHSSAFDFSDASFMGTVVWMDLEDAQAKFPDAKDALEATWASAKDSQTYDDKPKWNLWADYKRKRVRLCEHYWREGGAWMYCIFTRGGFVVEPQESPYMGDEDQPECPIKAVSLYVDRDNNRYGEVRTMIGPQDEINKRRSKALHLISQRQLRVSPATGQDVKAIREQMARPDGVLMGEQGDVEVLPTNDMAAANLQLLQEAKAEIDLLGPNAALGGKNEQALSGRAVIAQQQGGMTEAATYLDCIKVLSMAVYRSVWCRIKQHWKEERWIRITDNENNVKFVGVNRQVTAIQQMAQQMGVTKENMHEAPPEVLMKLEQAAAHPMAQQVVGVENNTAELDVDIVLDEGIDTPTIQAEQFDTIVKMIPALGPLGQSPEVLKFIIHASALRDKDKLLGILEPKDGGQDPQAAMQAQLQAQQAAVQQQAQMEAQVEIEKAQIAAQADIEVAKIKAATDAQIKQEAAQTDAQLAQQKIELEANLAERKAMLEHEVKSRVADATGETQRKKAESDKASSDQSAQMALMENLAQILAEMNRPKTKVPIRDENGFIVGVKEVYDQEAA